MPNNSSKSLNELKEEMWKIESQLPSSAYVNNKNSFMESLHGMTKGKLILALKKLKSILNSKSTKPSTSTEKARDHSSNTRPKRVYLVLAHGSSIPSINAQGIKLMNTFILPPGVSYTNLYKVGFNCPLAHGLDKVITLFLQKNQIYKNDYNSNEPTEIFRNSLGTLYNFDPKNHFKEGQKCNNMILDFKASNHCGIIDISTLPDKLPTNINELFMSVKLGSITLDSLLNSAEGSNSHFIINACRGGLNKSNERVARALSNNPQFNKSGGGSRSRKNKKPKTKTSRKPKTKTSRKLRIKNSRKPKPKSK